MELNWGFNETWWKVDFLLLSILKLQGIFNKRRGTINYFNMCLIFKEFLMTVKEEKICINIKIDQKVIKPILLSIYKLNVSIRYEFYISNARGRFNHILSIFMRINALRSFTWLWGLFSWCHWPPLRYSGTHKLRNLPNWYFFLPRISLREVSLFLHKNLAKTQISFSTIIEKLFIIVERKKYFGIFANFYNFFINFPPQGGVLSLSIISKEINF